MLVTIRGLEKVINFEDDVYHDIGSYITCIGVVDQSARLNYALHLLLRSL